ncbi:MAG: sigma-70 family RNA polymerase sigma factor [candidate division KSB1 bacterium]|nr:sigma-70 family RNA polymerase sigma factor [candidate division KSB1 bacterium]MDZ7342862.1 sigma-70 family RNA polymerase sigma factor [candidate division KSB1 bacterium]
MKIQAMEISEKELVQQAKKGDPSAQAKIVLNYEKMVYNLGLKLLGSAEQAECVLQETFLKVLQALPQFEERSQLSTWIYRIATNQALMRLRNRKRQQISFNDIANEDGTDYSEFVQSLDATPLDNLLNQELKEKMERAIDELPENYKTVFVMKDIEGLALKEIADVLDLSLPAVKSNLHRARVFLRNRLADMWN